MLQTVSNETYPNRFYQILKICFPQLALNFFQNKKRKFKIKACFSEYVICWMPTGNARKGLKRQWPCHCTSMNQDVLRDEKYPVVVQFSCLQEFGCPAVIRTTRTPAFWGCPRPPHDFAYYWVILDPKSEEEKVKVTNLKNSPKFQFFKFWNKHYTPHAFWSCLIRCSNMKCIWWVLLKIQSGHDSVHRRTDGQTDGRTDGQTDKVKPVYTPFNFKDLTGHWPWHCTSMNQGSSIKFEVEQIGSAGVGLQGLQKSWVLIGNAQPWQARWFHKIWVKGSECVQSLCSGSIRKIQMEGRTDRCYHIIPLDFLLNGGDNEAL